MHKVVLDMDPGIDDALALILALKSPELEILGITTVAGNAPVEMTSYNARRVLEYLGAANIPVAMGAAHPLRRQLEDALNYHGLDGLGNCGLGPPVTPLHPGRAWDLLAELVVSAPGEVSLVATGPLTNVAHAFELHREVPGLLRKLVVMGGAYGLTPYGKGNRTAFAEFNIWQDPEAARKVFDSGADIFAVGLDVTMDPSACLDSQHLQQLNAVQTPTARLVARLVEYQVKYHECCRMHDPLALATLLDDSLVHFIEAGVEVVERDGWDRGATRVLFSGASRSIHIASAVGGARFLKLFLSRVLDK